MNENITQLTNEISLDLKNKKNNLLTEVLQENNIPIDDNLSKDCKFTTPYGKDYSIFNVGGQDLLELYNPEVYMTENCRFEVKVKYRKLYEIKSKNN